MGRHSFTDEDQEKKYYERIAQIYQALGIEGEEYNNLKVVNAENIQLAEEDIQKFIDKGYLLDHDGAVIPKGKKTYDVFSKYILSDPEDFNTEPPYETGTDHFYFYTKKNGYRRLNVNSMKVSAAEDGNFTNVRRGINMIQGLLVDCAADLKSSEKPWSDDSDEHKKVVEAMNRLTEHLEGYAHGHTFFEPKSLDGSKLDHPYGYADLEKDFGEVMHTVQAYMDSHSNVELSSRQERRLKTLSRIQSVFECVRLAKNKDANYELTRDHFDNLESVYAVFFDYLKKTDKDSKGATAYCRAALTNRSFLQQCASKLSLEGRSYAAMNKSDLDGLARYLGSGFTPDKWQPQNYKLQPKNENERTALSNKRADEFPRLEAGILWAVLRGQGSANNASPKYGELIEDIKSGKILVFDRDGKLAEPENALSMLADNSRSMNDRPQFFVRNSDGNYEGRSFTWSKAGGSNDFEITSAAAFKNAQGNTSVIPEDRLLIYNDVIEETGNIIKELERANTSRPSAARREMVKALNTIYRKFRDINIVDSDPKSMQKAFDEVNEKANIYINTFYNRAIDDQQVNRLAAAQKIMTMGTLLKEPGLSYKKYLKTMYAEKICLDNMKTIRSGAGIDNAYASFVAKAKSNTNLQTANSELQDALTSSDGFSHIRNDIMDGRKTSFIEKIDGMSVQELKKLCRESSKATIDKYNYVEAVERRREAERHNPSVEQIGEYNVNKGKKFVPAPETMIKMNLLSLAAGPRSLHAKDMLKWINDNHDLIEYLASEEYNKLPDGEEKKLYQDAGDFCRSAVKLAKAWEERFDNIPEGEKVNSEEFRSIREFVSDKNNLNELKNIRNSSKTATLFDRYRKLMTFIGEHVDKDPDAVYGDDEIMDQMTPDNMINTLKERQEKLQENDPKWLLTGSSEFGEMKTALSDTIKAFEQLKAYPTEDRREIAAEKLTVLIDKTAIYCDKKKDDDGVILSSENPEDLNLEERRFHYAGLTGITAGYYKTEDIKMIFGVESKQTLNQKIQTVGKYNLAKEESGYISKYDKKTFAAIAEAIKAVNKFPAKEVQKELHDLAEQIHKAAENPELFGLDDFMKKPENKSIAASYRQLKAAGAVIAAQKNHKAAGLEQNKDIKPTVISLNV